VHEAVLRAGEPETGVTVHLVNERYDEGEILAQARVSVLPGDTPQALQDRVLRTEHDLYWRVIGRVARERSRRRPTPSTPP
jgi:phosphoribosylglycinamide formyltransferase-1